MIRSALFLFSILGMQTFWVYAEEGSEDKFPVKIRPNLPFVDLPKIHEGEDVRLMRNQDTDNTLDFDFAYTSRPCPPYCIQPMKLHPGVETVGELELIKYIKKIADGDASVVLVDSRTPNWLGSGIIPGAISIPWTKLHFGHTSQEVLMDILEMEFGVSQSGNLLNFEGAKTLIFYCNGNWCGQSVTSIRSLQLLGYPVDKLKWYRGGIQGWKMLGLNLVIPSPNTEN
ncbi:rhodanese-like domain-containing protein [Magnetococcales bacterium HHB-1]